MWGQILEWSGSTAKYLLSLCEFFNPISMKSKVLLVAGLLCAGFQSQAQILESYDFEDGQIPDHFIILDEDGRTPHANVSAINDAWVALESNSMGWVAASTSWYDPAGQSDDWMIIPDITLPATPQGNLVLLWDALAVDASYADGYEVKISTTTTDISAFTTDLFAVGGEDSEVISRSADLGAYAGQTVHIAFRNNSDDKFLLFIDNIVIADLSTIPDVEIVSLDFYPYHQTGKSTSLGITVRNTSGADIPAVTYALDFNGTAMNGTWNTTVPAQSERTFTINNLAIDRDGAYPFGLEISAENEENFDANALSGGFYGISTPPAKRVLIEEGTGTWCGWCPRGHVAMETLWNDHKDKTTLVAVHAGDIMQVPGYYEPFDDMIPGYPSGTLNRRGDAVDPSNFAAAYPNELQVVSPVQVQGDASIDNNVLTVNVDLTFLAGMENVNINAVITEDDVTGTSSDYDQVNYYAGGGNGPLTGAGHAWHNEPDPVPAAEMVYDHVARAILGGFGGEMADGSNFQTGGTYQHTFTLDLGTTDIQNADNLHVVVFAQDPESGQVWNSNYADMATGIAESNTTLGSLTLLPNPARDQFRVRFPEGISEAQVEVTDIAGRVVFNDLLSRTTSVVSVADWGTGVYNVRMETELGIYTSRLIKE